MSARRAGARGVTMIELMMTVAIMSIVMLSLMQLIITSSKQNRSDLERSELVRGGQTAMALIASELELAGLGLPRRLAIRGFSAAGGSVESCDTTAEIEVAYVDLSRQWTVAKVEAGAIALASAAPTPATATDLPLSTGEWLFYYKNAGVDSTGGGASGHGMVQVGATRSIGADTITLGSVDYSWSQTSFDLDQEQLDDTGTGHVPVVLRTRSSRFGVNCDDEDRPYLYWVRDGTVLPLATYADTRPLDGASPALDAADGEVVGLRFRFYVDADGDGQPDDQDASGTIDAADLVAAPADAGADLSQVTAIEVLFRLRSMEVDSNIERFRTQDFVQLVRLANINTRSTDYFFVDNEGL